MAGDDDVEVYDKKPQRYAEDNRAAFNCTQWQIWSLSTNNAIIKECARCITLSKLTTDDTKHRAASLQQQSYLLSSVMADAVSESVAGTVRDTAVSNDVSDDENDDDDDDGAEQRKWTALMDQCK